MQIESMFKYFKMTPLKSLQSVVVLGFCFSLCACQYFVKLQDHKQTTSTAVLVKTSPIKKTQLNIAAAEYGLSFIGEHLGTSGSKSHTNELKVKVNAHLTLAPKSSMIDRSYIFTLQRPDFISAIDLESNSCAEQKAQDDKYLIFKCTQAAGSSYDLNLSYDLVIDQLAGYQKLSEGERSYHLINLPSQLVGKLFIGFSSVGTFPRVITIQGPKSLKLFGHSLLKETEYNQERVKIQLDSKKVSDLSNSQKTHQDKRDKSQTQKTQQITRLTWSNTESDQAYPLFFGFGNWETATRFEADVKLRRSGNAVEQFKQAIDLISPLGSQHHRIGQQTLKSLQIKTLQSHAQQLSPLWTADLGSENELQSAKKRPLLFIILPEHPGYQVPDLREYGIIFIDESWFYRYQRFGYAMSQWDLLKVFKDLYLSLQAKITPTSNLAFLEALSWWRSLEHLDGIKHNKATQTDVLDHYQNYLINLSRDLSRSAMSYLGKNTQDPQLKQRLFASVINMIYQWLYFNKTNPSPNPLEQLDQAMSHSVSKLKTTDLSFEDQTTILGQQLNQLDSHIKQVLESYLNYAGLPLIYVKWTQKQRGDRYEIRFRVSQRPFVTHQDKSQAKLSIWVIPICFKLGIKDNPPRPYCFLLDQPEASHYELSLEAPLEWVHPNYGQTGLYLWALDSKEFLALLGAESNGLNLAEFLSLSDMSSALLEIGQGSPINYLKSVRELAKSQDQPLSLDTLFIHLNRVVHYFGSLNDKVGQVERWASSLLLGVMLSKTPKYPLDYLTQLQLAQWDRSEISMEQEFMAREPKRHKREQSMINRFLRPTSGQEAIEEDVAQVKLDEIQYPLLMKALLGDQKLWHKLHHKLAESEDHPLARLMLIQSLVQFIDPSLFTKTLDLLRRSQFEQAQSESELQESEDSKDVGDSEEDEDLQSDDAGNNEMSADAIADEEKQEELSVSLRVEDALEMIKAIKSIRAKRLAWSWLLRLKGPLKDKIMYANRDDIQAAMLEWATALCDAESSSQLKKNIFDDLSFNQSLQARANKIINEVERCVKMRSLKPNVEAWIQNSLGSE